VELDAIPMLGSSVRDIAAAIAASTRSPAARALSPTAAESGGDDDEPDSHEVERVEQVSAAEQAQESAHTAEGAAEQAEAWEPRAAAEGVGDASASDVREEEEDAESGLRKLLGVAADRVRASVIAETLVEAAVEERAAEVAATERKQVQESPVASPVWRSRSDLLSLDVRDIAEAIARESGADPEALHASTVEAQPAIEEVAAAAAEEVEPSGGDKSEAERASAGREAENPPPPLLSPSAMLRTSMRDIAFDIACETFASQRQATEAEEAAEAEAEADRARRERLRIEASDQPRAVEQPVWRSQTHLASPSKPEPEPKEPEAEAEPWGDSTRSGVFDSLNSAAAEMFRAKAFELEDSPPSISAVQDATHPLVRPNTSGDPRPSSSQPPASRYVSALYQFVSLFVSFARRRLPLARHAEEA